MISALSVSYLVFLPMYSCVNLSIRLSPWSLIPDSREILQDSDAETCTFLRGITETTQLTQFRFKLYLSLRTDVIFTLIGTDLGCGYNLYVTPLSLAETEKWTGRWNTCQLIGSSDLDDRQRCNYLCRCTDGCEEIQILKMPRHANESSWEICHLDTYYGCENIANSEDGIYQIRLPDGQMADVYCDMKTDGGGWTVLVRRQDGSVDFARKWEEYEQGFGSLDGEFWAGNEFMHTITTEGLKCSMRVDLEDYSGVSVYAVYLNFWVASESDNYMLHVTEYWPNSTAGDSMAYHDKMMFSSVDHDNDKSVTNCAEVKNNTSWWYNSCSRALLTGIYGQYPEVEDYKGIFWYSQWGSDHFIKAAKMMIRKIY